MRIFGRVALLVLTVLSLVTACEHKTRRAKTADDVNAGFGMDDPPPVVVPSSDDSHAPKWEAGSTSGGCRTQCGVDVSSTLSVDDQRKVASVVDPLLRNAYECLKRVGAYKIEPTLLLRLGSDGRPLHVRFDVGGYEELQCMKELERSFPNLQVSHGANVRCELRCAN